MYSPNQPHDSDKIQRSKFKREMAPAIRQRDNFTCLICEKKGNAVHHIKPWATNPDARFDPLNLATLCRECHWGLAHSGTNNSVDLTVAAWLAARAANKHDTEKWQAILTEIREKKKMDKFQLPDELWGEARRRARRRLRNGWPRDIALEAPSGSRHHPRSGNYHPSSRRGVSLSPEHCAKLSVARRASGQKISPENLAKLIAANTGRHPSAETRARLAASKLGNKHGKGNRGKKRPDIAERNRTRPVSIETRRKQAEAKRGRPGPWRGKTRPSTHMQAAWTARGIHVL